MAEIFNLDTLCRCCHADGSFKSLELSYAFEGAVEVYSNMLLDTFSVVINPPTCNASHAICDQCIIKLRDASTFKQQVLSCEKKFEEYCKNEQALSIKEEIIFNTDQKLDVETEIEKANDIGLDNDRVGHGKIKCEPKNEKEVYSQIDTKLYAKGRPQKRIKKIKSRPKPLKKPLNLDIQVKTESGIAYPCKICDKSFEDTTKLRHHTVTEHEGVFKCRICAQMVDSNEYLSHMEKHTNEREKCPQCSKSFRRKWDLMEHINTHTRKNVYTCNICQKDFLYKQSLRKHILWHSGLNKKCVCDICGCSFNDKTNMNIHIRTVHHKLRPYSCSMCPKTFTAKKHLTIHFRNHTGERPFQCDECTKGFTSLQALKRHKMKHDLQKKGLGSYHCKICQASFETRGKFVAHLRNHIGQKDFKCDLCGKDFTSKYSLNRHIDQHKGIKPFRCEICSQEFSQKTQLLRHSYRIHDMTRAEKEGRLGPKVRCDLCFRHVFNLDKHKLIHTKRPHSCEWCGKSYPERNTLNRHIKHVHVGEKPHQCKLCDKKYAKVDSLKKHAVKVHKAALKQEVEEP